MSGREFRYILEIANCKSISAAAKKLFISQPSLSQCLQKVELDVGEKLFDRKRGGLVPTFAGEQYIIYAKKALDLEKDFKRMVDDIAFNQAGKISIGVPPARGTYVLPKVLPKFKKKYPNIMVNVTEDNSSNLSKLLEEGKIEMAFMHLPLNSEKFNYSPLYKERIVLEAPLNHPLSERYKDAPGIPTIDPKLIAKEPFIFLISGQRVRRFGERVFEEINASPNIVLSLSNVDTVDRLVSEGYGLAFVPYRESNNKNTANTTNTQYPCKYFYLDCEYDEFTIVTCYNSEFYLSKAIQAFIDTCHEIFPYVEE